MLRRIVTAAGMGGLMSSGACSSDIVGTGGATSSASAVSSSAMSSSSGAPLCIPGQVEACPCPGGAGMGVQSCDVEGDGFGPCTGCGGASSSSGASTTASGTSTASSTSGAGGGSASSSGSGGASSSSSSSSAGGGSSSSSSSASASSSASSSGAGGGCSSPTEVDLYIAFDRSVSMSGNKWDSAKLGLSAFANDPDSAGIGVALNFFPLENTPTTCDQFAYQPPKVDFAPLPANAMPLDVTMAAASPTGFSTPIYPALGGAIIGANAYAQSHPGHVAAVLLVTDGAPEGPAAMCGGVDPQDPAALADLAASGVSFGIKTFVVGLPGVSLAIANQIAAAGGTNAAILVGGVDVKAGFQAALATVRSKMLCP